MPQVLHLPTPLSPGSASRPGCCQLSDPEVVAGMRSRMAPTSRAKEGAPRKALGPITPTHKIESPTSFGLQPHPSNLKRIRTNKHLFELISAGTMSYYKEMMEQHSSPRTPMSPFIPCTGNESSTPPDRLGNCATMRQ